MKAKRQNAPPYSSIVSRLALALVLLGPAAAFAEAGSGGRVVVLAEPLLAAEADALLEALSVKLASNGVSVTKKERPEPTGEEESVVQDGDEPELLWIVHVRQLSERMLLVAVDNAASSGPDDVVREVRRGADPEATGWTIALMVEELVLPYVDEDGESAPLGAGLAIIEPPEVGGVRNESSEPIVAYPHLRLLALGMEGQYHPGNDDIAAGPRFALEGAVAERFVATLGIAWVGWTRTSLRGVRVSASSLPIRASLGFVLLPGGIVEISIRGGVSVGFSIYRSDDGTQQRTDVTFSPRIPLRLRVVFRVHGPWGVYVDGGAAFALVRDELRNSGRPVHRQDWIFPAFGLGAQLWLD
ncbi:MAG: hypothetical protein R6V85_13565 [Polyangia bacterium]